MARIFPNEFLRAYDKISVCFNMISEVPGGRSKKKIKRAMWRWTFYEFCDRLQRQLGNPVIIAYILDNHDRLYDYLLSGPRNFY